MEESTLVHVIEYGLRTGVLTPADLARWAVEPRLAAVLTKHFPVDGPAPFALAVFAARLRHQLGYDPTRYDQYYYARRQLQRHYSDTLTALLQLRIPGLEYCVDDLDEEGATITSASNRPYPIECHIFWQAFTTSPAVTTKLFAPEWLHALARAQESLLRGLLLGGAPSEQLAFFSPIAYCEHHALGLRDEKYLAVLCYLNRVADEPTPRAYLVIKFSCVDPPATPERPTRTMTGNLFVDYQKEATQFFTNRTALQQLPPGVDLITAYQDLGRYYQAAY